MWKTISLKYVSYDPPRNFDVHIVNLIEFSVNWGSFLFENYIFDMKLDHFAQ